MSYEQTASAAAQHSLSLDARNKMSITGVQDVSGFDENTVILGISGHVLTVEGEDLHILNMSTESGEVDISGRVNGLYYTDRLIKKGGFFKR